MTITLNGQPHITEAPTLLQLLEELHLSGKPIIVEHNGQALHSAQHDSLTLTEGDQLELVLITAGG